MIQYILSFISKNNQESINANAVIIQKLISYTVFGLFLFGLIDISLINHTFLTYNLFNTIRTYDSKNLETSNNLTMKWFTYGLIVSTHALISLIGSLFFGYTLKTAINFLQLALYICLANGTITFDQVFDTNKSRYLANQETMANVYNTSYDSVNYVTHHVTNYNSIWETFGSVSTVYTFVVEKVKSIKKEPIKND
jgi:hypothetical protein